MMGVASHSLMTSHTQLHQGMKKFHALCSFFSVIIISSVECQVNFPCPAITELCANSTNDGELTCTVTTGKQLIWKILDNGMESGTLQYNKNDPLMSNDAVGMTPFIANLIQAANPLQSTLTFTPLEGMDGLVVQCSKKNDMNAQSCSIAIAGVPSAPINLALSQYTNSSVQLSWSSPNDSPDCVDMYSVSSNITSTIITTSDVMVTLTVPDDHISTNQYCASVAAVDYIGRTGQQSIESCFILDVPNPLDVYYLVDENLTVTWTSNQMSRPPLQEIHVIVTNANDNMSNILQLAPDIRTITIAIPQMEVKLVFDVTVIATNAIGSDEGTTIQVTVDYATVTSTQTQSATTFSTTSPVPTTTMTTTTIAVSEMSTSTGNTFSTTSGIPSISDSVYINSTEVMSTTSTVHHTSTITSVSISGLTMSPSGSPPLNQQSGAPWPVIGGALGGVLAVLIILIPVVICVCVVRMKKNHLDQYDIGNLENEAYEAGDLYRSQIGKDSGISLSMVDRTRTTQNATVGDDESIYDDVVSSKQNEPCTYQDPATITREQASTGDIYTVPLGKSTSKNQEVTDWAETSFSSSSLLSDQDNSLPDDQQDIESVIYDEVPKLSQ